MTIRRFLISAVALAVLAAGCSRDSTTREVHRPAPKARIRPVNPRDVVMRPKRFFDDTEKIVSVTVRLARRCMKAKGFRYDGLAQYVDRYQGELEPDMAYLRAEGYGFAFTYRPLYQPPESIVPQWARAFRGDGTRQARFKTLVGSGGTDAGGCFGAAKKRVAGSVENWLWAITVVQDYWLIFSATLPGHQRWRGAVIRWRACMAEAGWPDIGGPDGPRDAIGQRYAQEARRGQPVPDDLRRFEIELATLDARCRTSSGVVDVSRELRKDFLASASPEYRRDLERIATARTKALRTIQSEHLD